MLKKQNEETKPKKVSCLTAQQFIGAKKKNLTMRTPTLMSLRGTSFFQKVPKVEMACSKSFRNSATEWDKNPSALSLSMSPHTIQQAGFRAD
jgi:hypothetical protein